MNLNGLKVLSNLITFKNWTDELAFPLEKYLVNKFWKSYYYINFIPIVSQITSFI